MPASEGPTLAGMVIWHECPLFFRGLHRVQTRLADHLSMLEAGKANRRRGYRYAKRPRQHREIFGGNVGA